MPAHKRILLKLSGEALMGDDAYGINRATIVRMVREIREITELGVEVAVVIGGGNIFRGVAGGSVGMDRATADYMGMLATVMNALALADTMRQEGMTARVMSAESTEATLVPTFRFSVGAAEPVTTTSERLTALTCSAKSIVCGFASSTLRTTARPCANRPGLPPSTSVGRGFDSVSHTPGTYRNRIRIQTGP